MRRTTQALTTLITTAALALMVSAVPADAGTARRLGSFDVAGLWPLNEGTGQRAYDWSGSGNTGQLGSTAQTDPQDPAWVALPRVGWLRRSALRFDGSQYVRVANAPSLEPDGLTLAARVRSDGPGAFKYVASKGALSCETASYGLYTGSNGGLQFYVSDGTNFTLSSNAGTAIWDGAWHTAVGVFNGRHVRLFVDGTEVGASVPATLAIGYGLPDGQDFLLGDYAGPCGSPLGFIGDIDGAALIGHSDPGLTAP
ncbi:LamG domain-containing protein [Nocardioides sp.]|uniref:LamG domain-containing protein n=1 Tax=Nocardioides sp. TaxID=35761 RepID=UPI00286E2544|nr:LamG domain-containing protein [Nocardioides sp.]